MNIIFYFLIAVLTFLLMECLMWLIHKYIMHGFLWIWHRSHHSLQRHRFEPNDIFTLGLLLTALGTIIFSFEFDFNALMVRSIGIGILFYSLAYFLFHDIILHRRIRINYIPKSRYMKRLINAHFIHHSKHTKNGCESFGFLFACKKYDPKYRKVL